MRHMKWIMVRKLLNIKYSLTKAKQKGKINMRIKEFLWDLFTITEWSVTTWLLTMACIRAGGDGDHHRPIRRERIRDLANKRQTPEKGSQTESELIICNSISSLISNLAFFSPAGVRLNWSQLLNNKWNALFLKRRRKFGPRTFYEESFGKSFNNN